MWHRHESRVPLPMHVVHVSMFVHTCTQTSASAYDGTSPGCELEELRNFGFACSWVRSLTIALVPDIEVIECTPDVLDADSPPAMLRFDFPLPSLNVTPGKSNVVNLAVFFIVH